MKKTDTNELLTIYRQLDEFKSTARDTIMKKCGWSRDSFFKKLAMPTKMSEVEYEAVKNVLTVTLDQCTTAVSIISKI